VIKTAAAHLSPQLTDADPPHRRLTVLLLANHLDAAADLADRRRIEAENARNHIEAFERRTGLIGRPCHPQQGTSQAHAPL